MDRALENLPIIPRCFLILGLQIIPFDMIQNIFAMTIWFPKNHEAIEFWMKVIQFILFSAFTIGGILSWQIFKRMLRKYTKSKNAKNVIEHIDKVDHAEELTDNL